MALFLLWTFYATMVLAALGVEFLFEALDLQKHARNAKVVEATVTWNYTTYLNIVFLALAAALVWRFVRAGGIPMLKMMNMPMDEDEHAHQHHHDHAHAH